jgi:hypothetical protein
LPLDSGNFTAFEVNQPNYFIFSDATGWRNKSTSSNALQGGFAWPGRDQFVLLLKLPSRVFSLVPLNTDAIIVAAPVLFNCSSTCYGFTFSAVSTSGKLLLIYQDTNQGLIVNYVELQANQIRFQNILTVPSRYLLNLAFFDGYVAATVLNLIPLLTNNAATHTF